MQNELQRLIKTYQQDKQINVYYDEDCKYESSLLKKFSPICGNMNVQTL